MKLIFLIVFFNLTHAQVLITNIDFIASTNIPGMEIKGNLKKNNKIDIQHKADKIEDIRINIMKENLTTGLELRDDHLYDFLTVKSLSFQSMESCQFKDGSCTLRGTFIISDKAFEKVLVIKKKKNIFTSQFDLSLKELGYKAPTFAGVTVLDKIEIFIKGVTSD